jgi:predicted Zn-dependent peptidase
VSLVVGAGRAQDPPERRGLANLVARLVMRAHNRDGAARDLALQSVGATSTLVMGLDDTSFRVLAHKEAWPQLLATELELLTDPLAAIDERDLDAEVALLDDPATDPRGAGRGFDRLLEALFEPEDSYGGVQSARTLEDVTLAEVRAFAARYYRPSNATLYVDGDLPTNAHRIVRSTLEAGALDGGPPRSSLPAGSTAPFRLRAGGPVLRKPARVDTPELWVGWALPSAYGPQAAMVELATGVAGHLLFSDRLRGDDPDIVSLHAFTVRAARATILACQVTLTAKGDPDRAAKVVASHVSEEWSVLAGASSKAYLEANAHREALEERTLLDRATRWPTAVHYVNDPRFTVSALRSTDAIDAAASFDFVQKYLTSDVARSVLLTPSTQEAHAEAPDLEESTDDGKWPVSSAPSPSVATTGPARTNLSQRVLANGLTAIIAANAGFPLTTVGVGFHGGAATDEPLGASAVVGATGVLVVGSLHPDAHGQSHTLEPDQTTTLINLERSLVPRLLERVGVSQTFGWVQWPDDPKADRLREHLRIWQASPSAASHGALRAALYPEVRWGRSLGVSDLEKVSHDAAVSWSEAHRAARNAAVVVAGNVPDDLMSSALEQELRSWEPGSETVVAPQPLPPGHAEPLVVFNRAQSVVGATVHFGCRLPPEAASDFVWREVLANAVSRTLDRRLRRSLAATGDVSFEHHVYRGGTSDLWGSLVVPNHALPRVVEELQSAFAHLAAGRWTGGQDEDSSTDGSNARLDLELRRYATFWFSTGASSDGLASRLLSRWNLGWPLDDRAAVASALATPNVARLTELAKLCHQTAVISVAADPSVPPLLRPAARPASGSPLPPPSSAPSTAPPRT